MENDNKGFGFKNSNELPTIATDNNAVLVFRKSLRVVVIGINLVKFGEIESQITLIGWISAD